MRGGGNPPIARRLFCFARPPSPPSSPRPPAPRTAAPGRPSRRRRRRPWFWWRPWFWRGTRKRRRRNRECRTNPPPPLSRPANVDHIGVFAPSSVPTSHTHRAQPLPHTRAPRHGGRARVQGQHQESARRGGQGRVLRGAVRLLCVHDGEERGQGARETGVCDGAGGRVCVCSRGAVPEPPDPAANPLTAPSCLPPPPPQANKYDADGACVTARKALDRCVSTVVRGEGRKGAGQGWFVRRAPCVFAHPPSPFSSGLPHPHPHHRQLPPAAPVARAAAMRRRRRSRAAAAAANGAAPMLRPLMAADLARGCVSAVSKKK